MKKPILLPQFNGVESLSNESMAEAIEKAGECPAGWRWLKVGERVRKTDALLIRGKFGYTPCVHTLGEMSYPAIRHLSRERKSTFKKEASFLVTLYEDASYKEKFLSRLEIALDDSRNSVSGIDEVTECLEYGKKYKVTFTVEEVKP